jgi:amidohydrolase
MNICDSHLHVGQFYHLNILPKEIIGFANNLGIQRMLVSSTSTCEEDYDRVLCEMKELLALGESRVLPALWVTPLMIARDMTQRFLDSGIHWRCVKIHPQIHPYWTEDDEGMDDAILFSRMLHVPLLVHTGEEPQWNAGKMEQAIRSNPDVNFILAHSRPLDQTLRLLADNENAYADTAFCPLNDMMKIVKAGLSRKLLWGSDCMIPQYYYPDMNIHEAYISKLTSLKAAIAESDFSKITLENFNRLFK